MHKREPVSNEGKKIRKSETNIFRIMGMCIGHLLLYKIDVNLRFKQVKHSQMTIYRRL